MASRPVQNPIRPRGPRIFLPELMGQIALLALASIAAGCGSAPLVQDLVIVKYRHVADFKSWQAKDSNAPPPEIGDDEVHSIYEITSISNMDLHAKPFALHLDQIHLGTDESPAVLDASSLVPEPRNGIVSNLTSPTTTLSVPAGQTLSPPHLKVLVERKPADTLHLFYTPGAHVIMLETDTDPAPPNPIKPIIPVLTPENFPDRRQNLIYITYKHFQTFRIYDSTSGFLGNLDPGLGVLYKIETIQVEPEANGKGTFLLSSLRSCADGDGVAIDPGSLQPPIDVLLQNAMINPLLPSSQLTFTAATPNWIVMFRCPHVSSAEQSDKDIPLSYIPIADEEVILKGEFPKGKWRNEGALQQTDIESF